MGAAPVERRHGGLTRSERDARRRRRLLDAGLEVFGTTGYASSTITGICREAHVTARNFYDHFASREDLLMAVGDDVVAGVRRAVSEALAEPRPDPVDQVRAGLTAFAHALAADPRRLRVNFLELVGASPRVEAHRQQGARWFSDLLLAGAQHYQATGALPERDLGLTVPALAGAVQGALVDWAGRDAGERPPVDAVVEELVRLHVLALGPVRRG